MAQLEKVKNTGVHPVDLADGRSVAPGETMDGVDLEDAHNADLVDQGLISRMDTGGATRPKATPLPKTDKED